MCRVDTENLTEPLHVTPIRKCGSPFGGYVGSDLKADPVGTVMGLHTHPDNTPAQKGSTDAKTAINRGRPEVVITEKLLYIIHPSGGISVLQC